MSPFSAFELHMIFIGATALKAFRELNDQARRGERAVRTRFGAVCEVC